MVIGTASDTGPETMASKRQMVANASPAPASAGSQSAAGDGSGNDPVSPTQAVRRTRPPIVTPSVVRAAPTAPLVRPAMKSSVPQHSAAVAPRRTGFIKLLRGPIAFEAVGPDQILAGGVEMPRYELRRNLRLALSQGRKNRAVLLVVKLHLGP